MKILVFRKMFPIIFHLNYFQFYRTEKKEKKKKKELKKKVNNRKLEIKIQEITEKKKHSLFLGPKTVVKKIF